MAAKSSDKKLKAQEIYEKQLVAEWKLHIRLCQIAVTSIELEMEEEILMAMLMLGISEEEAKGLEDVQAHATKLSIFKHRLILNESECAEGMTPKGLDETSECMCKECKANHKKLEAYNAKVLKEQLKAELEEGEEDEPEEP